MKKTVMLLIIASLLLAVGCGAKQEPAAENAEVNTIEPVNVKTEKVKSHIFSNTLQMPGEVKPYEEVMITAKIGGDIASLNAEIGVEVAKGQTLGKFDPTLYSLTLQKAKLAVDSAEITLRNALQDYENYKTLYAQNAVSKTTYDTFNKVYEMADIGLKAAKADYASAKENYDDTTVYSPIDGIVSQKNIAVGENLSPGAHMFSVVNMKQAYVEAGVSEMNVNRLAVEMPVTVNLNSVPGATFEGVITHIGPVPGSTNTYPVKILISNEDQTVRSGMYATAEIQLAGEKENLAIPKNALQHEGNTDYVLLADGDLAKRVNVEIGLSDEHYYEVVSGLKAGDPIIVSGQDMVGSGEPIAIQN